ncbi:MAG: hypothetical protein AAF236_11195 [Verrucomicrobiota bacterium]
MNEPVCIYRKQRTATIAAARARQSGAETTIKTATVRSANRPVHLHILQAPHNQKQKVIDIIADASRDDATLATDALQCPHCDSIRLEYPEHAGTSPSIRGIGKFLDFLASLISIDTPSRFSCRRCSQILTTEEFSSQLGSDPSREAA